MSVGTVAGRLKPPAPKGAHAHDRLAAGRLRERTAVLDLFRMLTPAQRRAYFAALAGWSLDALDFFVFVFCLKSISG